MCTHAYGPGEEDESAGDQEVSHGGRSVDLVLLAPADPGSVHALHSARKWRKYVYGVSLTSVPIETDLLSLLLVTVWSSAVVGCSAATMALR